MSELVRVLRLVEYVGPREWVEETIQQSIHGTKDFGGGVKVKAETIWESEGSELHSIEETSK